MDIYNIFKSKTRKELFRLYFTNPEQKYYLRELERILDIPVSMIRRELLNLEKAGMHISEKRGNQTYYYLNRHYPLFDELKSIVAKTIGIQGSIRKSLESFKDIEVAFIYGSYARNEDKAGSDIDVLIIGNVDDRKLNSEIHVLEEKLKREVNYTIYSSDEFKRKKRNRDPFILDVMDNPKIFLVGKQDDLGKPYC
ncbi:nucleotidyltransferase domain-containing protein [candidate division WOR-3 bacterium]|nr:nucleotidyltransferase domain-containing protein [candidate division WOR-3 bacterium]